jgi:hypothetical protein
VVAAKLKENSSSDMFSLAHRHELDLLVRSVNERGTPEPLVNLMVRVKSMAMKAFPMVDAQTMAAVGRSTFYQSPQQQAAGTEHMSGHANHPKPGTGSGFSV